MKNLSNLLFLSTLWLNLCPAQQALIPGMTITQSCKIKPGEYRLDGSDSLRHPAITIAGDGITVDFAWASLIGSAGKTLPNEFFGTGILIKGKNITLKNAVIRGYKVAVMAEGVDSLQLLDCHFSYNWRPKLLSIREREDFSDWLSYHHNEQDEWLRYGAAMYLKNCDHALVKGVTVTQGMNGLLMTGCNGGLFYNNNFSFNSGLGIGMYRSSGNRIMHNKLDWNVRGYSHGIYQRGQDSAGILVYEQSNENTFAFNSATHSGDGFFLWAGQHTMDTGEGGCNDNLLYFNDFSHAPTNGVEVTFSRNNIIGNRLDECTYGIWGGYSFESNMVGNHIEDCKFGIAIEHGQDNVIAGNELLNDTVGVQIWARATQPADWGYAEKRDVRSRNYVIARNLFSKVRNPLKISASQNLAINDANYFEGFDKLLLAEKPNEHFLLEKNYVTGEAGWKDAEPYKQMNHVVAALPEFSFSKSKVEHFALARLADGMNAMLPAGHPRGRKFMLMNEWGPYNFGYPAVFLANIEQGQRYTFELFGHSTKSYWELLNSRGWKTVRVTKGSFPYTLVLEKSPGAEELVLEFEYIGLDFYDQFGNLHPKGELYTFSFRRFEKKFDWQVRLHNYDETTDPQQHYEAFKNLKTQLPKATKSVNDLWFAWWGSPAEGVSEDKFAAFAETTFDIAPGAYLLRFTSDDGIKVFLDGKLILDNWDIHEPETEEIRAQLGGKHRLEIEHFDGGGFATLGFVMEKE